MSRIIRDLDEAKCHADWALSSTGAKDTPETRDGEDPAPASPSRPDSITPGQRSKIFAAFRDAGITSDARSEEGKAARLAYIRNAIGREVTSTNDLRKVEAGIVIEMLEKDAAERATVEPPLFAEEPQS